MEIAAKDLHKIRIIQITDSHIAADPDARFDGVDTSRTLQDVVAMINREEAHADLLLATGDLVHEPDSGAYTRLTGLLGGLKLPVFCIPGNHDSPELLLRQLNDVNLSPAKHLVVGNWQVILLNTCQPGREDGLLDDAELDFLQHKLSTAGDDHVLLALHHHPLRCGSPWMDTMMLSNAGEFLDIIEHHRTVRVVIWGHIHQEFSSRRNNCLFLGCPSTCVQFKPETQAYQSDGLGPGYRVLELSADGVVNTRVKRPE